MPYLLSISVLITIYLCIGKWSRFDCRNIFDDWRSTMFWRQLFPVSAGEIFCKFHMISKLAQVSSDGRLWPRLAITLSAKTYRQAMVSTTVRPLVHRSCHRDVTTHRERAHGAEVEVIHLLWPCKVMPCIHRAPTPTSFHVDLSQK